MDNKWIEDAFTAFQQENAELHFESLTQMMLQLAYWAEENELDLKKYRRRAKTLKQMFDAADHLIKDGFDPWQVASILQDHMGVTTDDMKDMELKLLPKRSA